LMSGRVSSNSTSTISPWIAVTEPVTGLSHFAARVIKPPGTEFFQVKLDVSAKSSER
jgi:hypothetical protein